MSNVYLAIYNEDKSVCKGFSRSSQIFTDELTLARYVREQWDCYIFQGLQKVESVENTVILEDK